MDYHVVINRDSGSGLFRDPDQIVRLESIFHDNGHGADIHVVDPNELADALQHALDSSADRVIVGGGDGTVTSAAKIFKNTGKAIGVLPLGTFNLEARELAIPLDPFQAMEKLLDSAITEIDLMTVNGACCLCATVIGFYPQLAKTRENFHGKSWWLKSIRVLREILTVAVTSPALYLSLTTSDGTVRKRTRLAAFSPGEYQEDIGLIPSRADLASGKINAYVSAHLSRRELVGAAFSFLTGTLFNTERMTLAESPEITIDVKRRKHISAMIDGEIMEISLPCRLEILPRALKVLRPRSEST